jgi:hypothetical protein
VFAAAYLMTYQPTPPSWQTLRFQAIIASHQLSLEVIGSTAHLSQTMFNIFQQNSIFELPVYNN